MSHFHTETRVFVHSSSACTVSSSSTPILYLLANRSAKQGSQDDFYFYFLQVFLNKWMAVKTRATLNPLYLTHPPDKRSSCPEMLCRAARPGKSAEGTQKGARDNAGWRDTRSQGCIWGTARRREKKKQWGGACTLLCAQGIGTDREKPQGLLLGWRDK